MNRTGPTHSTRHLVLLLALTTTSALFAQHTNYWVGGPGAWNDDQHWASSPGGPGGAGVPSADEDAVITGNGPLAIELPRNAECRALTIDGTHGLVTLTAPGRSELRVGGDLRCSGATDLSHLGALVLDRAHGGAEVDLRGTLLGGDVRFQGGGIWSLLTDLTLGDAHELYLREGTLVTNSNTVRAGVLRLDGHRSIQLIAGGSVLLLAHDLHAEGATGVVQQGRSHLFVADQERPWGAVATAERDDDRGISICGTGPGQTPFTINAQVLTNYNGFNVSCSGSCDATVTVTVTGGSGNFSYNWSGGGPHTQTWTNTCVGNKLVIVTDVTQGIGCAATVQVQGPPPLGVIFFPAITPPTCAQVCNGSANALAVGGTGGGYTYSWNNGAGTGSSFNGLCAGNNSLHIVDQNLCQFDTTFSIDLQPIRPNLVVMPAHCNGGCDGTATVSPTGGTGNLTIDWQPGTPQGDGTPTVSQLCAGNYSVTITDANGCDTTVTFQITQPPPILPNLVVTNATCSDVCNGQATVNPTGAAGPYTFQWSPAPGAGQGTNTATGLCAGVYHCTIRDQATLCDTVVTVTIGAPLPITPNATSTNATCSDLCNGTAGATPSGGSGTYTYSWSPNPPLGQGTGHASGLCPGTWSLTITDIAGCDTTVQFTITAPPPVLPGITHTDVTCAGACDGTITCAPSGGTGAFTFSWSPNPPVGQGTAMASQLCAGVWSVTITDANGCDTTVATTIVEPLPLNVTGTQTNVTCGTNCDGTITANVSGGTAGYTYSWSPAPGTGQGTASAGGLCAGAYTLTVTDSHGCVATHVFTILAPTPIVVLVQPTNATCPGLCNGSAIANASGGSGALTYTWNPAPGAGQGTNSVTGLCPQNYQLTVQDALGCDTTISFTIGAPTPITPNATSTNATCAGLCNGTAGATPSGGSGTYTYSWSPNPPVGQGTGHASGLCPGAWSLTITDAAGCDTLVQFTITAPPPIVPAVTHTDVTCAGACDGTITAAPTGGTGAFTFSWSPNPPVGQGTAMASQLCAGTWSVTIADANGCDTVITTTIVQPPPLDVSGLQTNVSCGTNCDGTITAIVSGGTAGYTYSWSPAPGAGQGTSTVSGLCAGVYDLTVTDAHNCTIVHPFTILAPSPIVVQVQPTNASCPNVCDGSAIANASGGAGTYSFTWSPAPGTGQGTNTVTGLCAQSYQLTVQDASGCDTTISFTISAPPAIAPHPTAVNATCHGACNGSITLAPTGGTGSYTYTWSPTPPNGQGQATATSLCAGTWQVTVHSGSCDSTLSFTITEPPAIDAGLVTTPVTCAGDCDGTAVSSATGGSGGFSYTWSPAPGTGQGTPNAGSLCPGSYTLTITDAATCDTVIPFAITAPPPVTAALTTTLASCGGGCDGTASVVASGGSGPLVITWSPEPGAGQGTTQATGLCPGPWSVTIADPLGCDTTIQFLINTPSGIHVLSHANDASCSDVCDGSITLITVGGVPPYTYTWSPVPPIGADEDVGGLCPGPYTVTIGDQAGCDTVLVFVIGAPPPILPNGVFTNETCQGPCDGTATVAPSGGSGNFSFLWSPVPPVGQGTASASGLCAGNWSVTITDDAGCDTVWTFTVLPQQAVLADLTAQDVTCPFTCDGSASVVASGGSGGFTYHWSPEPGAGQGTPDVTGLCLGQWSVTVTDMNGCDTTVSFVVNKPAPITPSLVVLAATCNGPCTGGAGVFPSGGTPGYQIVWQPAPGSGQGTGVADGLCAGTQYSVTITDTLGCDTTATFLVPDFTPITPNLSSTPATCHGSCNGTATTGPTGGEGPYQYNWSPAPPMGQGTPTASGLCAGSYDLTITDANGCDTTVSVLITEPNALDPAADVHGITCHGACDGSIVLNTQGGTGAYTYAWSPQPPMGQGTASVSQLCAGTWSVTITDGAGCDTTVAFQLTDPTVLHVTPEVLLSNCQQCVGQITLHATGGGGGYLFNWGAPINVTTTDSVQQGLCAGLYPVTLIDALGCLLPVTVPVSDSNGELLTVVDDTVTCPTDCDGLVSVSYNCSAPGCTTQWFDALGTGLANGIDSLGNLCAGIYLVQVTNGNGCITIDSAQVIAPAPMMAQISSSPVSCSGLCDGTAAVGIVGGVAPYTINWSPAPQGGQGTPLATGLCPGSYDITLSDAHGCSIQPSVLILGPTPIAPNATVQDVTCAGLCNGSISLNTQGGTGAYTYLWNPVPPNGQGTSSATQLCPGSYAVTIRDGNACDTTLSFTINAPAPLVLAPTAIESHCAQCDGAVVVIPSGGTGTVNVDWTNVNAQPIGSGILISGLCAGLYTATATDDNGCTAQAVLAVTDATGETLTVMDGQTTCSNACDGSVSVSFTCTSGPCEIAWYDANAQLLAQNQFGLTGLCQGLYLVAVHDGAGCTTIDTAMVTPSQQIVPNLSTSAATCHGACDGTAAVGPTGGTAPYTITWDPPPAQGQGTPLASGLCAGNYTVTIADSTGCDTLIGFLILEPALLQVDALVHDISCNGVCDGSIDVTPSGGSGSYTYNWSPAPPSGQGTPNVSQLCAGVWSLTLADLAGCDTVVQFTIAEPPALTLTTSSTQSVCGSCSGTVMASATGGTPNYSYTWQQNGALFGTDSALTDLCAALYVVTATDANGCQAQQAVPVSDVNGEVVTTTDDFVTCPGQCDGVVMASFNCGVPACTVAWYDQQGTDLSEPGTTLDSLCAGLYFVQVTNGNGCVTIDTAMVIAPQPIQPNLSTSPASCAGNCDGTATVNPTGGVAPYTYTWDPPPGGGQGTPQVTGLCAGSYTVTIADSAGCSIDVGVLILEPTPITATATLTPITCNGACDGTITVVPAGGDGSYTYTWDPVPPNGQGNAAALQLCAGDWSVTIADGNGCDSTYTFTLTDPPALNAQVTTADNVCFGDCQGQASADVSGGTGSYTLVWTTAGGTVIAQDTASVDGLCAGDYLLNVTDSLGCATQTPFTISQGTPVIADLTTQGETCAGPCDGTASVAPSGGNGSYAIVWTDPQGTTYATDTTAVSGLCAGNWSVTITDIGGCDTTYAFTIAPYQTIDPHPTVTQVSCQGACNGAITVAPTGGVGTLTYAWSPVPPNGQGTNSATGLCPGDWSLTITDGVNCDTTVNFTITEPAALDVQVDQVVDASCSTAQDGSVAITVSGGTPGYTIHWTGPGGFDSDQEDISALAPGTYSLTVSDTHGCTVQLPVDVGALSTVSASAGADTTLCFGTPLILDGSASQGATSYTWTDQNNTTVGTQAVVTLGQLATGTHTFTLTVADGPCSSTDQVVINVLALPLADAGPDQQVFIGATVTLGGQPSGPPGSTFQWMPDTLVSNVAAPNPTSMPPGDTWFVLYVTSQQGCTNVDSVLITVSPEIKIPSGFTPNGDGANDVWQIDLIDQFPNCTVEIYNRWGSLLFTSVGYKVPWDGTYKGGQVPVGTYYYAIELHDERFPDPYTGPLTVIR